MKNIAVVFLCVSLMSFYYVNEIYNIKINDIDGKKVDLADYKGKKLLFVIIPVTTGDTTVRTEDLSQLQIKYQGSLKIIGVPAEDMGFKKGDEGKIKALYKNVSSEFLIAEGMKVKKGDKQSALFGWLTDKTLNRHFDKDVKGIGSKFFVDEYGELFASLGPELKLNNPLIEKILRRQRLR